MLPKLETGFLGAPIYTSSLVIAWLQVIVSGVMTLIAAVTGPLVVNIAVKNARLNPELDETNGSDVDLNTAYYVVAIVIVFLLLFCILDVCLLVGVYKGNHCLMMPYLIAAGVANVLNILSSIFSFICIFFAPFLFGRFLVNLFFTVISCYCWLVLHTHYQDLKDEALKKRTWTQKI